MTDWSTPEYWNARFEEEDTPWEVGGPSPTLCALEEQIRIPAGARVLVPGCGRGEDAIYFAEKGYRVTVIDWSTTALSAFKEKVQSRGLSIEIHQGDFRSVPSSWNQQFQVIVEHTFFCSLDPEMRSDYRRFIKKMLQPGGDFLGALFVRAGAHEGFDVGGPPFFLSEAEMRKFFQEDFDLLCFEPSPHAPRGREEFEWWAHFRLRVTNDR